MSSRCVPPVRSTPRNNLLSTFGHLNMVSSGAAIIDQILQVPAGVRKLFIANAGPYNYLTAERVLMSFKALSLPNAGGIITFQGNEELYSFGNAATTIVDLVGMGFEFDDDLPPQLFFSVTNNGGWAKLSLSFAYNGVSRLFQGFNI